MRTSRSTKQIMDMMAIPDSNALVDAGGKEKAHGRGMGGVPQACRLARGGWKFAGHAGADGNRKDESSGQGESSESRWVECRSKVDEGRGKAAIVAIDKKDLDMLGGDVGEKILTSCAACHDEYADQVDHD